MVDTAGEIVLHLVPLSRECGPLRKAGILDATGG